MKVIAYSIKPFEKAFIETANHGKHAITLLADSLNKETAKLAKDHEAIIVFTNDDVSAPVINLLHAFGVKYIIARSTGTDHIDKATAEKFGIKVFNVPSYSPQAIAEHAVALAFALNRNIVKADEQSHIFNFSNDELIGFNFFGKTVGLIGLGSTGLATANIFNGLGCKVIGFDLAFPKDAKNIKPVDFDTLLATSDIISLHLPLTSSNKYLINRDSIAKMKNGVMLINTSRGALLHTRQMLDALKEGKVGYLGIDVYEYEKGLFFEDHTNDDIKDNVLGELMKFSNVLVTPHQAYLTKEALQEIALKTIKNLDACK